MSVPARRQLWRHIVGDWIDVACRWSVAAVLVYAATLKVLDVDAFAKSIGDYGSLPPALDRTAAVALILAEFAAATMIVSPRGRRVLPALMLILTFTAAVGYGLWLGLDIDCGCLGPGDRHPGGNLRSAMARNLALLAALSYTLIWRRRRHVI